MPAVNPFTIQQLIVTVSCVMSGGAIFMVALWWALNRWVNKIIREATSGNKTDATLVHGQADAKNVRRNTRRSRNTGGKKAPHVEHDARCDPDKPTISGDILTAPTVCTDHPDAAIRPGGGEAGKEGDENREHTIEERIPVSGPGDV